MGCIIAVLSVFFYSVYGDDRAILRGDDDTVAEMEAPCMLAPVFGHLGYILTLSPLLCKTYRMSKIFNNSKLKRVTIKDKDLVNMVAGMVSVWVVLLIVWMVADPPTPKVQTVDDEQWVACETDGALSMILLALDGFILLWGSYLCYEVRN